MRRPTPSNQTLHPSCVDAGQQREELDLLLLGGGAMMFTMTTTTTIGATFSLGAWESNATQQQQTSGEGDQYFDMLTLTRSRSCSWDDASEEDSCSESDDDEEEDDDDDDEESDAANDDENGEQASRNKSGHQPLSSCLIPVHDKTQDNSVLTDPETDSSEEFLSDIQLHRLAISKADVSSGLSRRRVVRFCDVTDVFCFPRYSPEDWIHLYYSAHELQSIIDEHKREQEAIDHQKDIDNTSGAN